MAGVNQILPFAETDTGTNLLTQSQYAADAQRPIGNQPGIARSPLVNKVMRQATFVAHALAQLVADVTGEDVLDDGNALVLEQNLLRLCLQAGYALDTGAVNAYVIDVVPAPLSLEAGMEFSFLATNANTGASTIVINGSAPIAITKSGTDPLAAGDIPAGSIVKGTFDGTRLQLGATPATGATGGGSDKVFYENDQNVTADYTIPANKNAMSAGPITINTGVTVTVSTGATWTVV